MRVKLYNTDLVFRKNSVTVYASQLTGIDEGKCINGRTGEDRTAPTMDMSMLMDIPAGAESVNVSGTGYETVDTYSTFALYKTTGEWIVSGADGSAFNLQDYPEAKKFKMAWFKSKVDTAKVRFTM